MQHFKEFLSRIQTFDLQIITQKENIDAGANQKPEIKFYDITHETPFYKSFSYKSELRVLKDMAFIDVLTLDRSHIGRFGHMLHPIPWQNCYHFF